MNLTNEEVKEKFLTECYEIFKNIVAKMEPIIFDEHKNKTLMHQCMVYSDLCAYFLAHIFHVSKEFPDMMNGTIDEQIMGIVGNAKKLMERGAPIVKSTRTQ